MLRRRLLGLAAAWLVSAAPALAERPWFDTSGGLAISGYDVVAYFTEGQPVRGRAAYAVMWKGATWHFASAENRTHFEMNPRAYAPQYGGYCAYSVARGTVSPADPEAWRIHENRLYLTHTTQVGRLWAQDIPGNILKANANWPGVLNR
ncbi:MAG: YHS domain-containing protein [Rhodobacteraceae bacterium]|nr:MAG: YHS domain-containing protein [Paracoccaceae bacterium]